MKIQAKRKPFILCAVFAALMILSLFVSPVMAYADAPSESEQEAAIDRSDSAEEETETSILTPNSATPPSSATGTTTTEAQDGTGSVTDSGTQTDVNTGKQFVTVQTKSGKIFYLIIDHDKSTDNVFLLTEVTENDLLNFVEGDGTNDGTAAASNTADNTTAAQNGIGQLEPDNTDTTQPATTPEPETSGGSGLILVVILVIGIGGAAFYFFKVKKRKSDPLGSADDFDLDDEEYTDDLDEPESEGEPDTEQEDENE